ncbi:Tat-binding [Penicillium macrosclerotiorum]|uniref:Tat-binding n=1 Tax=Penicillium macrosclerotiorum TaxID=303699 RepID=UPI002546819A|nr:Tat-binding [Penicillium macrosclerotiorum]KAJ5675834.1 Tat-binding [Penicillium macrosclerotiorum]
MPRNPKRSLEELANKSDSNDEDWSEESGRATQRTSRKSKSNSKKRSRPAKRRRRGSDDIVSDDASLSDDDLSVMESEEDSDDPDVERNARGTARRRTTQAQTTYEEPSDDESFGDDEDDEPEVGSPLPRKSTMVTLKLRPEILSQPQLMTRRITRRTRGASEEMYALTNSGHHMETVERGTMSPETGLSRRRGSRASKQPVIHEETVETSTEMQASLEILESDAPQSGPEGDTAILAEDTQDVEMITEGVVPESENGDVKNDNDDEDEDDDEVPTTRRRSRPSRNADQDDEDEGADAEGEVEPEVSDAAQPRRSSRKKPSSQRKGQDDESDFEPEEEESNDDDESVSGKSGRSPRKASQIRDEEEDSSTVGRRPGLRKRPTQSRGQSEVADELREELQDLKGGRSRRRIEVETVYEKPRRNRKDVDYRLIRPEYFQTFDDAENELITESPSRRGRGGGGSSWQRTLFPTAGPFGGGGPSAILGPAGAPAATGGVDSDSSDDEMLQQPKPAGLLSGGGLVPQTHSGDVNQNTSGTPANFGKIKDRQALADADPLGVDMNVNFDSVGGLQGHIDQLKEMVSLPLLYPEIFQRFHIVPPRGVLFHGPPGTGKTLLARALANSVSSEGRKVTFYMRKGADALSKWVGEAERQLRLLFEEARKTQPSIIFFDEIDGLAPVRSSKQEQIHASIVSTLLALMDGMDGRGQVIVIGATNRPDSVDPALRRPGRFDREFYFPLPNIEGRRAILDIHTKGWEPPLPGDIKDELAKITKGYGGADLRALCTEAALNAVQRRYPQIYKSDKKLVIDPKNIDVIPKDFMLAIKKMVPSSERSTSSGATALPHIVEPLLRQSLLEIETSLSEILPQRKRLTALEEAQYEEPEDGNGFKREQMMQEFDRSRVFRPRLLLRGSQGMGQQYLAAALLHHFEGLHVQAFDLPTLLSDSTRSPEATVIQLFSEVKRHKPSVIYIPNIQTWIETVGPAVISTFLGLLRSIPACDPVLLLGVLESTGDDIDAGLLKNLFGFSKKNLYDLSAPGSHERYEFFGKLIEYVRTPPSDFPDPENRKKRQLEELEVAPPPAPQAQIPPTKKERKAQKKKDHHTLNLLKIRIQPIMDQIKKYKRFRTGVIDDAQIRYLWEESNPNIVTSDIPPDPLTSLRPFEMCTDKHGVPGLREVVSNKFFYNMEIVTMEKRLSNGYYKRASDFLADIKRIAKDAHQLGDPERILRANELLSNVDVDIATIEQSDPALMAECENVHLRELAREQERIEAQKLAEQEAEEQSRSQTANGTRGDEADTSSGAARPDEVMSDDNERPTTPTRQPNVSFTNGEPYPNGGGSDLNEPGPQGQTNGDSSHGHGDGDGDVLMTNSEDNSGSKDTQISSFGPSAQPLPPYSYTAPSQQVRRESGMSSFSQTNPMTPMAAGSQPADYTNEASTTQTTSDKKSSEHDQTQSLHVSRHDYPDLTQYPDRISQQEEHLPDTQQGGSSQPSPRQDTAPNGSQSQAKPQPPLFDADKKSAIHTSANLQALLNDEPSPELVLDKEYLEHLHNQLAQQTSGCSVEQLEQINTCLMDCVWRMRSEWNRTIVAESITETFNAVLEDMLSIQEIGPISQNTKQQMAIPSYRV